MASNAETALAIFEKRLGSEEGVGEWFTMDQDRINLFADATLDHQFIHVDPEKSAQLSPYTVTIAHGFLSSSFISTVIGTRLPGPGCVYVSQSLKFKAPVRPGDTVTARATVTELDSARNRATLRTTCTVGDTVVIDGEAVVLVPSQAQAAE